MIGTVSSRVENCLMASDNKSNFNEYGRVFLRFAAYIPHLICDDTYDVSLVLSITKLLRLISDDKKAYLLAFKAMILCVE